MTTTAHPGRTDRAGHPGPEPRRRRTSSPSDRLRRRSWSELPRPGCRSCRPSWPTSPPCTRRTAPTPCWPPWSGGGVRPLAGRRRPLHLVRGRRGTEPASGRAGPGAHPAVGADPIVGGLPDRRRAAMTTAPPILAADLTAGLKRLKMAGMRRLAPELLLTAKTQRWNPEEFLRTLVEAEIAARDASNARTRRRQAMFPVNKTLDEFDLAASSVPRATLDYLSSLEWVRAAENVCLIGPAGTGKSHLLLALGSAAVDAGHRVRYYTAAELLDSLYRGLADNSVGKIIDGLLRYDLVIVDELGFAPLDDTGAQLLFRFVAAAYERRSLGIGSHWPFESWGRFLPEHTTAVSMLDRLLHHCHVVITDGDSYRMKQARARGGTKINNH